MSRKSKGRRDDNLLSLTQPLPAPYPLVSPIKYQPSILTEIEDMRTFQPGPRSARTFGGMPHQTRAREPHPDPGRSLRRFPAQTKAVIGVVNDPFNPVVLCIRRQQRREVLHSLNRTGAGGGNNRKPRRTARSKIKC